MAKIKRTKKTNYNPHNHAYKTLSNTNPVKKLEVVSRSTKHTMVKERVKKDKTMLHRATRTTHKYQGVKSGALEV